MRPGEHATLEWFAAVVMLRLNEDCDVFPAALLYAPMTFMNVYILKREVHYTAMPCTIDFIKFVRKV